MMGPDAGKSVFIQRVHNIFNEFVRKIPSQPQTVSLGAKLKYFKTIC